MQAFLNKYRSKPCTEKKECQIQQKYYFSHKISAMGGRSSRLHSGQAAGGNWEYSSAQQSSGGDKEISDWKKINTV